MQYRFEKVNLPGDIELHVLRDPKFKSTSVTAVLHSSLSKESVTKNALLPRVLRRGIAGYPETVELERRLEELYGASLDVGIAKKGLRHLLVFEVEVADSRYVGSGAELFRVGMDLLNDMIFNPVKEQNGLRNDYTAQEKENLKRLIQSLIDNKQAWAMRRCVEVMLEGDDSSLFKYGRAEDIDAITPQMLLELHHEAVRDRPIDIFVVGDLDPGQVADEVGQAFAKERNARQLKAAWEGISDSPAPRTRTVVERVDVNQGNLVMGFRTGVRLGHVDYPALIVANGVFGRYSHSKLFQIVRERESLAYSVWSSLDSTRGLLWVTAGIDFGSMERTVELVQDQLSQVQQGLVSKGEMENTLRGVKRDFAMMADQPGSLIDFALEAKVNDADISIDELRNEVSRVTVDDVMRAAKHISLDTVYFLTGEERSSHVG